MKIRPANEDDFESVRDVARRAWSDAYAEIMDGESIDGTIASWYSDDSLTDAVERPGTLFLVATRDDDVLGFCHAICHEDEGDLLRLYVDPDHWGDGIGSALYERLRSDLRDINMKRIRAMVLSENTRGTGFYRRLGFEKSDEATVEIGDGEYGESVYTVAL
ncbi:MULTISPECIES: GNAT family N-acetyltransferase [unclassified Haladaptatus]|uniref:GNAT family N-acetyltransferase n=1 Tax=unclassified Haladaptatus TaxID=2622732 RepID=UPI00209C2594|nr:MULTISPECIES: GNAT family N-acetyltransferase [unclassified Haladaptatus]MCO8246392.1 GNAT family N-acetyltransferase [Haladaptatus sp. AB643]MCO8255294.1 GNAT family N-acetyltransferase [Haladaptatus sp. AB618]